MLYLKNISKLIINNNIIKKIFQNINIIDIKIINSCKLKKINETLTENLKDIFDRYRIKNNYTNYSNYSIGLMFHSPDIYRVSFKKALKKFKKTKTGLLNPKIFPNSILNSLTSNITKDFNIRGFSNSYIHNSIESLVLEFIESNVKKVIIINIYKKKLKLNRYKIEILFLSRI